MKSTLFVAPLLAVSAAVASTLTVREVPIEEFIARVSKGEIQCDDPEATRKQCSGISTFEALSSKKLKRHERLLFDEDQNVVIVADTISEVKRGLLCFTMTRKAIDEFRFERDGKALSDADEKAARAKAEAAFGTSIGVELCEAFLEINGKLKIASYFNGKLRPSSREILLVRPDAGYKIGK